MCAHSGSRVQRRGRDAHSLWRFLLGIGVSLMCYILLAEAVHVSSLGDGEKWSESIAKDQDRGGGCHNQVGCQLQGAAHSLFVMTHVLFFLMVTFPADSLAFVFQLRTRGSEG